MTLRPHRRQTWRPAELDGVDLWVLLFGLLTVATVRGADYATTPSPVRTQPGPPLPATSVIEAAFPLWIWGIAMFAGAAVLLVGITSRAHLAVFIGHGWLFMIYGALAIGVVASLGSRDSWNGYRSAGDLAFISAMHFVVALRTGPAPSEREDIGE